MTSHVRSGGTATADGRSPNAVPASLSGVTEPAPAIPRSHDLVAAALLTVLLALKGWERIHFNEWMARVDILGQYLPWWSYLGAGLRSFDIPGWNPHQFAGTPFLGDPQSGWMYLPVMTLFTLLPPVAAMKAYVVVHLLIGGLSMYALGRVIGFRPPGAFAAAAAFAFGPFLHHTTYCCNIQAHLAAWLPAALIGVELALRASTWDRRLAWLALTGFAIAQILAGWIGQGAYNGLLVIGAYVVYRTLISPVRARVPWRERLRALAVHGTLVLAIGFGLGAASTLPRLEINRETNLAGGNYANVHDEEKAGAPLLIVLSRLINTEDPSVRRTYIGGATLALALLTLFFTRRAPIPFFAVLAVVPIVLTMETTWLHRLFYLLPRFEELHEHARIRVLAVYMIGASLLAGATVDAISRNRLRFRVLYPALLIVPLVWSWRFGMPDRHRDLFTTEYPMMRAVIAVSLLLAGAVILARARPRSHPWLGPATAVALIVVLLFEPAGREALDMIRNPPAQPGSARAVAVHSSETDPGGAGEFLQRQGEETASPFRYFGYFGGSLRTDDAAGITYQSGRREPLFQSILVTARSIRLGLFDIQGYNPVQLQRTVDLFVAINGQELDYHDANVLAAGLTSPWLDVLGVRYVVVPAVVPGIPETLHIHQRLSPRYPPVFGNGRAVVYERPGAYPRAWLVHELEVRPRGEALALIQEGRVDPSRTAIVEPGAPVPRVAHPADPSPNRVVVTSHERDRLAFTVTAEAPGVLVVAEAYSAGWRAEVDGEATEVLPVNGALQGVPLPAGEHEVVLRYAPRSIPLGLALSGGTLFALVVAVTALRRTSATRG